MNNSSKEITPSLIDLQRCSLKPKPAIIYPMIRNVKVEKTDSVKHLSHEPVKAAVTNPEAGNRGCASNPVQAVRNATVAEDFINRSLSKLESNHEFIHPFEDFSNDRTNKAQVLQQKRNYDFQSTETKTMEEEIRSLKEQLEVQTKVNADLKKLLVASIGDDLHYKVDALVKTKVQLANEIGDYTRKLVEDYEDLDKISIQADLWHSKYQASRVLADKLTVERDQLKTLCAQSRLVIEALTLERQQLKEQLLRLHKSLQVLHKTFGPSSQVVSQSVANTAGDNLSLAAVSNWMMDGICYTLIGSQHSEFNVTIPALTETPAEKDALYVLGQLEDAVKQGKIWCHSLRPPPAFQRFHPDSRYDTFTFSNCKKCKGDIHVV